MKRVELVKRIGIMVASGMLVVVLVLNASSQMLIKPTKQIITIEDKAVSDAYRVSVCSEQVEILNEENDSIAKELNIQRAVNNRLAHLLAIEKSSSEILRQTIYDRMDSDRFKREQEIHGVK